MLSIDRVRSCSRKARDYMVLYKAVESLNLDEEDGIGWSVGLIVARDHTCLKYKIRRLSTGCTYIHSDFCFSCTLD